MNSREEQRLIAQPLSSSGARLLLFLYDDVLRDGEHAGNTVSPDAGDVLVHLVGRYSFQSHLPVLNDDVDRGHGLQGVAGKRTGTVDRPIHAEADAIVIGGEW